MGWRRDRIANEKIVPFHGPATRQIGTTSSANFDLRAGVAVVGAAGGGAGREILTNILLTLQIDDTWGAGGTLTVLVNTGDTAAAIAFFATSAQCTAAENVQLYLMELRDLQRFMRVDVVLAGAACQFSMLGNVERSRREPVFQLGTEKAITYSRRPAVF